MNKEVMELTLEDVVTGLKTLKNAFEDVDGPESQEVKEVDEISEQLQKLIKFLDSQHFEYVDFKDQITFKEYLGISSEVI